VMQAGAMGLPSIVTNINGCNEIITQGKNGLIIPVKDKEALLGAMALLAEDPKQRKALAANARETICRDYERREFWKLLLEEYRSLEKSL